MQAGEILGVAGVQGNGQTELCEALMGLRPVTSGSVHLAIFEGAIFSPHTVSALFHQKSFSTALHDGAVSAVFNPLSETAVNATPLILAGLSVAAAFRAGLFNIGAQSQLIGGAILATWLGFGVSLPPIIHVVVCVLGAFAGGAALGWIVGFLKARTGAHEVIVTIMLNYVMAYLLSYLLSKPSLLEKPGANGNLISPNIAGDAHLSLLAGTHLRINAGFLLALAAGIPATMPIGAAVEVRGSRAGLPMTAGTAGPPAEHSPQGAASPAAGTPAAGPSEAGTPVAHNPYVAATRSAARLAELTGQARYDAAVVLGSGWAPAADALARALAADVTEIPVAELGGFAPPSVPGHAGSVQVLTAGDLRLLVFLGRTHLYEGHPISASVHDVRTAMAARCQIIALTNTSGGIRETYRVGEPVIVRDHLNLTGRSPLYGPPPPEPYPSRFVDLTGLYSPRLRRLAREADPR